jgi:hypothetical protein
MHHYRGTLFQGDKIRLDPANVYIEYHSTQAGAVSEWSGYFLVESEKVLASGGIYTLKLVDGRAGELQIETLVPDESDKTRVTFVGKGSLT